MARLSAKLRSTAGGRLAYWCQGCEGVHHVWVEGEGAIWGWDGNVDAPTFTPSVLITSGHYVSSHKLGDKCWCTYAVEFPHRAALAPKCERCHTFIRSGMVEFLGDCTHAFAGKTEPLPDWPYAEGEYEGV